MALVVFGWLAGEAWNWGGGTGALELGVGTGTGKVRVVRLTSNHFWPLKVLIWMNVAGRNGKVKPHEQQKEIGPPPHGWP